MTPFETFLQDLDRLYASQRPAEAPKVGLRILGSVALMIQAHYIRGTKDGDVLESALIHRTVKADLLNLGGKGTGLANRHGIYLDIVPSGILFMPNAVAYHPLPEISSALRCFEVEVMDITDPCVTKLKRFNANDQADLGAMVRLQKLDYALFRDRFLSAIDHCRGQAFADDYPRIVDNFHQVERDIFLVSETAIDLRANPYESED
ncbi:DUF6036 family nucleotidyltransferase [Geothrix sp. 21YS21S-2]|uniref:DUF6036 family nucleotidyltransferase n=1 Tax=Geothrix sp. 21YS21S-2 TaxID=3068893 RepID=UPI0027B8B3D7|nr:DUF6036 family nucleotidyltransferase [Geothrix sp. 21YS21S-2]